MINVTQSVIIECKRSFITVKFYDSNKGTDKQGDWFIK